MQHCTLRRPEYPLQQDLSKQLLPRTLHTPSHPIALPTIPPAPCIPNCLLVQTSIPLTDWSTSAIRNNTSPCPLATRLNSQVLFLELPPRITGAKRIPNRQRIMQLQTHLAALFLRIELGVLLERSGKEKLCPLREWGARDGLGRDV